MEHKILGVDKTKEIWNIIETFLNKYGIFSLLALALSIIIISIVPKKVINYLPFDKQNYYWALIFIFTVCLLYINFIKFIYSKINTKIANIIYKESYTQNKVTESLHLLWNFIDSLSEAERNDIRNFLNTNNQPISKGFIIYDSILYNSNVVIKTEKRTSREIKTRIYNTNEEVTMTTYDTHLYKLKEEVYTLLKYSYEHYGKIGNFE